MTPHATGAIAPLRHRRTWLAVGAAFVALVAYLSLASDAPDAGRLGEFKIGHVIAYAWLMLWYAQLFAAWPRRIAIGAALCAFGVLLEYLQGMTGYRTYAVADMRDNAIGVALGLALAGTALARGLRALEKMVSGTNFR